MAPASLRTAASISALVLGWALGVSGQTADDLLSGVWKANLSKSRFSPDGLAPKSITTTFEVADGQIKALIEGLDFQGRATRAEYVARLDGKDYPWKGMVDGVPSTEQDTVAWRRIDPYTYEIINKLGGETLTTIRVVVAPDGRTRTITARGGGLDNTVVFEKQ